jgi:D-alanyl-D-alanine carboxypeptidase (penicillin-binding protein 5/6)
MKQQKYYYKQENYKSRRSVNSIVFAIFISAFVVAGLYAVFQRVSESAVEPDIVSAEVIKEPKYNFENIAPPVEGQFAIANLVDGIDANYVDEQLAPIASLTKLITALAVLDKAPIEPGAQGDELTLTAQDEQYYWDYVAVGGTVTPVTAGLQMTQYEALQTMLLASSNNMSDTLVDKYFESKEEYVNYANNVINNLGLTYTKVVDTTGFAPENVSTPTELLLIGKKSLENPVIAEIVAQKEATVSVAGGIPNYNALIDLPYVTGLKPGLTDEAGYCLLFSMDVPNSAGELVTTIGVVTGMRDTAQYKSFILSTYNQVIEITKKSNT